MLYGNCKKYWHMYKCLSPTLTKTWNLLPTPPSLYNVVLESKNLRACKLVIKFKPAAGLQDFPIH